jgi:DNA-binding response OmpR family regulator
LVAKFNVIYNKNSLSLTMIEFKLMAYFIRHAGRYMPREAIVNAVWNSDNVASKTLNTHLTNLRAKIKESESEIKTLKGWGHGLF